MLRIETYANARLSDDVVLQQFATARLREVLDAVVIFAKNDPVLKKLQPQEEETPEDGPVKSPENQKTAEASPNGRGKVTA